MDHVKESLRRTSHDGDFIGALIAGMCIGFFLAWTRADDGIDLREFTGFIFLGVCSYEVAALLLPLSKGKHLREVPNWILISIAGSLIYFVAAHLAPSVRYIWQFRESNVVGSVSEEIVEQIITLVMLTVLYSLIALPIVGMIHYISCKVACRGRFNRQRFGISQVGAGILKLRASGRRRV